MNCGAISLKRHHNEGVCCPCGGGAVIGVNVVSHVAIFAKTPAAVSFDDGSFLKGGHELRFTLLAVL